MTPTNQKILEMIMDNKTIEEICSTFNLTRTQLKTRIQSIKKEGYRVDTMYSPKNNDKLFINYELYNNNAPNIITCDVDKSILVGVVADTHIGSDFCDMDSIKTVYEFFNNSGVNFVFHLGDLVDGDFGTDEDIESQVLTAILDYPHDDNIRNFVILGNHDEGFVKKTGIDVGCALEHYRDDFISLGYGHADFSLQRSKIRLSHKPTNFKEQKYFLTLGGHVHKYIFYNNSAVPRIVCPTLSKVNPYHDLPGALTLKFTFNNADICDLVSSHYLVFDNKVIKAGEINYQYSKKR